MCRQEHLSEMPDLCVFRVSLISLTPYSFDFHKCTAERCCGIKRSPSQLQVIAIQRHTHHVRIRTVEAISCQEGMHKPGYLAGQHALTWKTCLQMMLTQGKPVLSSSQDMDKTLVKLLASEAGKGARFVCS